ncbi:hypothetical protein C2R22_16290 [Salinigranum rubrum]|uniref:Uncharacterized protein n=1 Tax=Salinigranum rubrum TaxID=755307 RepID=A0A2I8VPG6_9EURY|nr:hypothetical protein [Salinigranum rubrum]AUV83009.1 hypothetical protein C2R22_16290 [Salinigranum rubrum]
MSSETDEGYVHRPGAVDDGDSEEDTDTDAAADPDVEADSDPETRAPLPGPEPTGFGNRGWVLVATVVLCFLVVPGVIYLRPALPGEAGLSFIVAMLVLPLLPALLLGLTAVWSMAASRRR